MEGDVHDINADEQGQTGTETAQASNTLPGGTITFLFTDIEGSTRLLERLRDQYAQVLGEHRELLRETFQRWRGHEVGTQGDAFFVAFGKATDAVACAIEAQQRLYEHSWPPGVSFRVRMGLHTGEALVDKADYVGMDVHRASRITNVGHGGQVLLSQTTRDLVCASLPPGARLRDLGAHMLKDLRFPQQIYQLEIAGLPSEFPPLKSLEKLEKEEEPPAPGKCPYMGLQYFDEDNSEWFFGRRAVTDRLVEAVSSQHFLAVIGASGSGKSSAVRAGLVPAIKAISLPRWQVRVITPSSHPVEALAISLTQEAESVTATVTLIDDLQRDPRSLHLYCQKHLSNVKDARILLVVDQFEELFTSCRSESERLLFVKNLMYAVKFPDSRVTAVIALRADFYECMAQYTELREMVASHQVYIGAMDATELRSAIEDPAKRGGWKHRRGSLMDLKAYTVAGGVRGAIAKTAETVFYRELTPEQQEIAKGIFLRLTELGEGAQDTRRRISIHELIPPGPAIESEQVQAVLGKLADARLITMGESTVEVAHEALIREWPTLREWLAADREGLRLHRHLTEAAQEWVLLERETGSLYRGARLSQAVEWAMANPRSLSAMEQDFLEASRQAEEWEQAEREAQRQRDLEAARKLAETERKRAEEQEHSAQRLRRRAWWLGGVLALALILAGVSIVLNQKAQESARLATSRYLTSAALNNLKLNSQLSAHLALQAYHAYPTNESENVLHLVLPELRLIRSIEPANLMSRVWQSVALARAGELMIKATPQSIEVTDLAAGTLLSTFAQDRNCDGILSTPDGHWLMALCFPDKNDPETGVVEVWDVETQKHLFTLPTYGPQDGLVPPSSSHALLAYACLEDLECHIWEVPSGKDLFVLSGHTPAAEFGGAGVGLTSTQDGNVAATYGSDGQVILWDLATGKQLGQFDTRSKGIAMAAFSPDGTHLATWALDNTIKIWDATSPALGSRLEMVISQDKTEFPLLLFSQNGSLLVTGSQDGLLRLWDVQTGKLQITLSGHEGFSFPLCFSQDGKRLFSTSNDGTVKEWDVTPKHELLTLSGFIGIAPFSPDGTKLALSNADGTLFILNSQTGEVVQQWQAHSGWIDDIAWSPDGTKLATTNGMGFSAVSRVSDSATRIWDASTGQLLTELPGYEDSGNYTVVWRPDGQRLMAASWFPGNTRTWDTSTWNLLKTQSDTGGGIWAVAYSPDGEEYATSTNTIGSGLSPGIQVWDAATGNQLWSRATDHTTQSLAYSPDGKQLAASQSDGSICLFTITDNGIEERIIRGGSQPLVSIAFSSDGRYLASGDAVGKVTVWDTKTMKMRLQMPTFPSEVLHVAFSLDNRRLVASSADGVVYFQTMVTDELIQNVSERIILPMTDEECREYLHSDTCPKLP